MSKKITLQVYADTKEEYCDVMDQLNEITDIDIIEKSLENYGWEIIIWNVI